MDVAVRVSPGPGPAQLATVVVAAPHEDEALISDALASALRVVILDPKAGLWQLRDRLGQGELPSESPETW